MSTGFPPVSAHLGPTAISKWHSHARHGGRGNAGRNPGVIASRLSWSKPPLGTSAILGGDDELFRAERIATSLRAAGINVLVNGSRAQTFEGASIRLVRFSPDASALASSLAGLPPGSPAIALTHGPAAFARMPEGLYLILSEYAHGDGSGCPWWERS
jgi:predicted MPP superfamily phosphohydrolase